MNTKSTNKHELLEKLEKAKSGLASNDLIEGADAFLFTGSEIVTFNDEICNRVQYETKYKGSVPADPFFKIIQKMSPDKDGCIDITEKRGELLISSKKANAGIQINPKGTLPIEELGEFPKLKEFKNIPPDFLTGLSMAFFCASKDTSTPILSCVFIDENKIKSTDSFRAFYFEMKEDMPSFLFPVQNISTLKKYNIQKYCLGNNWIHFKTKEGYDISIRSYPPDEFPDIEGLFDSKGSRFTFPGTMPEILDKATVFCNGAFDIDNTVQIKISGVKLIVTSKSELGWFKESTVTADLKKVKKNKGSKLNLNFETNPTFLKQILSECSSCLLCKEDSRIIFKGDNWKYILSTHFLD
jgi:hypothetical protein